MEINRQRLLTALTKHRDSFEQDRINALTKAANQPQHHSAHTQSALINLGFFRVFNQLHIELSKMESTTIRGEDFRNRVKSELVHRINDMMVSTRNPVQQLEDHYHIKALNALLNQGHYGVKIDAFIQSLVE